MIFDAPLDLPETGRYFVLGETDLTKSLVGILEVLRPAAEFSGFVSTPGEAEGAAVLLCDASVPGADELIRLRASDSVRILPVPVGDMWAWWEFADRALDKLTFDGTVRMDLTEFGHLIATMNRASLDPASGKFEILEGSYLSLMEGIVAEKSDEILKVLKHLRDDVSRATYSYVLTGKPENIWARYVERVFRNV